MGHAINWSALYFARARNYLPHCNLVSSAPGNAANQSLINFNNRDCRSCAATNCSNNPLCRPSFSPRQFSRSRAWYRSSIKMRERNYDRFTLFHLQMLYMQTRLRFLKQLLKAKSAISYALLESLVKQENARSFKDSAFHDTAREAGALSKKGKKKKGSRSSSNNVQRMRSTWYIYVYTYAYTLLLHLLNVYLAVMMRSQASMCRDYIRVRAEGPFTCRVSSRANMRVPLCRRPCLDPAGGAYCTRYVLLKIDGSICRIM